MKTARSRVRSPRMGNRVSELDRYIRDRNRRDALMVASFVVFLATILGVATAILASDSARQPAITGNITEIQCQVCRIIDGDTLVVDIMYPWNVTLRDQTVRCMGYDAWESSKRRRSVTVTDEEVTKGKLAASAFSELLNSSSAVYAIPGRRSRGPYGRILATLSCHVDGERIVVADWMRSHGHVRRGND